MVSCAEKDSFFPWDDGTRTDTALSLSIKSWRDKHLLDRLVILENHPLRKAWNVIIVVLLLYTGTILPFKLCFIEFRIPDALPENQTWTQVDLAIDILFWVDLVANFFFTYRDRKSREVMQFSRIVVRYLRGWFFLNLVACLPSEVVGEIMGIFIVDAENSKGVNKSVRLARLQRVSRLARLVRLTRLTRLITAVAESDAWSYVQSLRGIRVVNFFVGLLWIVHIVACGWYLCAALHEDAEETWVGRRTVDSEATTLLSRGAITQWLNAMYFVLTVFTTVGFGDINAVTSGEIVYVCFTMLVGAVVNSIILSEVITIITSVDQAEQEVKEQKDLVEAFARHTSLGQASIRALRNWSNTSSGTHQGFDRKSMRDLFTSGAMPRSLTGSLPADLWGGELIINRFLTVCHGIHSNQLPPRFPLLIALNLTSRYYEANEIVYFSFDIAWSIFLVQKGTFANIAKPSPTGGLAELPPLVVSAAETIRQVRKGSDARHDRHDGQVSQGVGSAGTASQSSDLEQNSVVSPYQLYGRGSYFGDAELVLEQSGPRKSCVRCESRKDSCVLSLHKADLTELLADFPRSGGAWRVAARRRENHREKLLKYLTKSVDAESLAASTIQRHVRDRLCVPHEGMPVVKSQAAKYRRAATSSTDSALEPVPDASPNNSVNSSTAGRGQAVPKYAKDLQVEIDRLRVQVTDLQGSFKTEVGKLHAGLHDVTASINRMLTHSATIAHSPRQI